jgi:hypothetical protein
MEEKPGKFGTIATLVQVLAVVVGVVLSIMSFNSGREKEEAARQREANNRTLELQKPFILNPAVG